MLNIFIKTRRKVPIDFWLLAKHLINIILMSFTVDSIIF